MAHVKWEGGFGKQGPVTGKLEGGTKITVDRGNFSTRVDVMLGGRGPVYTLFFDRWGDSYGAVHDFFFLVPRDEVVYGTIEARTFEQHLNVVAKIVQDVVNAIDRLARACPGMLLDLATWAVRNPRRANKNGIIRNAMGPAFGDVDSMDESDYEEPCQDPEARRAAYQEWITQWATRHIYEARIISPYHNHAHDYFGVWGSALSPPAP